MYEYKRNSFTIARGPRHPDIVDRPIDRVTENTKIKWCAATVRLLADAIRKEGIIIPILIWKNADLHTGLNRLIAARRVGLETVPLPLCRLPHQHAA